MAATDTMLIKRIANLFFLAIALLASAVYVCRHELSDAIYDSLASNDSAIKRKWFPKNGGRFILRPAHNDVSFLRVSPLHVGVTTSLGVPVSFDLTNLGDDNDFPTIVVIMTSHIGKPMRRVVFEPSEYAHDSRFGQQHLELLLQPRSGERGFTVQVLYGNPP